MKRLLLAALLGSVPAVPALAQDSVHVPYDNAALLSAQGRTALEHRVAGAVNRMCGDTRVPGSLLPDSKVLACRATAMQAARPQIDRAIAQANRQRITEMASATLLH